MSNWNMPPGVNTNMIPGNRPEDLEEDAFWEEFGKKLDAEGFKSIELTGVVGNFVNIDDLWDSTDFVKLIQIARDMGYAHGYNEGSADRELAHSMEEYDKETEEKVKRDGYACDDPMVCVKCNYPLEACQYAKETE